MWRVLRKISAIVREELDALGALETLLPQLQPAELWERSGRWQGYTAGEGIMFHLEDRQERNLGLGPTHEEVITDLAGDLLRSYKQLPVTLYQIQTKFRDEIRPRFGLMRGREFIMKDAYSFHADEKDLEEPMRPWLGPMHAFSSAAVSMPSAWMPTVAPSEGLPPGVHGHRRCR